MPRPAVSGSVTFAATDPDDPPSAIEFTCALDHAPAEPCTSPFTFTDLPAGPHTLTIVAYDRFGNPSVPLELSWFVDLTPPVLSLPADITVAATSPAGTTVTFAATASDDDGTHPLVTCVPASGATFAIGTTTVACSATDVAGNAATGSFHVTVLAPSVQIDSLIARIEGYGLSPRGHETGLVAKLHEAQAQIAAGDPSGACDTLRAFTNHVRAQTGKALAEAQAAELTAAANAIRGALGCPSD